MNCSKEDIVVELQRVYKLLGKPFSRREFAAHSKFAKSTIENRFGSWSAAIKAAGLCDRFEKYRSVQEEMAGFEPEKIVEDEWKKRKTELRDNAEQRKVKWLRDQSAKKDILMEMLADTLTRAEPPVIDVHPVRLSKPRRPNDNCTLWFEFSDLQLGTLMTSEEMGGLNAHNWVIWKEKLEVWKNEVIRLVEEYASIRTVDQVVIACLGDMVEGQDIFKGQTWQVDRHVVDQAIYGANDCSAAFAEICLTFPSIDFHMLEVFGNHGRVQRKGESPYSCSMDKVFQRFMEVQLRAGNVHNLTYHQNEAWFYLLDIYNWHHLLLHGDQGMSGLWSSRPTVNALEKGVTRYNQMLQQQIHFVHAGHFHNDWNLSFNMSQVLINGSFVGTSTFSASQMVAASPPVQVLHVFEPRVGLAKTERIHLLNGNIRNPLTPRTLKRKDQ